MMLIVNMKATNIYSMSQNKRHPFYVCDNLTWVSYHNYYKKAVLLQGEPRDAPVNFDMYQILQ